MVKQKRGQDLQSYPRKPIFTYTWEQRKLSTEFKRVNERNDGSLGRDKWISVAKMYFQDPEKVTSNNIDTRTYVMREGDIAFEGHPNAQYKYGRFVANDIGTGVISELFPIYRHIKGYDNSYWKQAIQLESVMQPIFAKCITSSGNSSNKLDPNHFLRQTLLIPSIEEQKIIGSFFDSIDSAITLHQGQLETLKNLKNAMLQTMFPTGNQTKPEIRFPGFNDTWEQRKLGEIFENLTYGLNAAAKDFDGINQYLRITDIDDETHTFLKTDLKSPDVEFEEVDDYLLQEGDILFARTGASVGKTYKYRVKDGKTYFAGFLIKGRPHSNFNSEFVFQNTLTDDYKSFIIVTSQRSGQPGVNSKEYASYKLRVPQLEEQNRIGDFLESLDSTITLHQRRLELLGQLKKGLLQQMFV